MKQQLKLEVVEKISTLATAGFGLVAALAWNDAIQKLFKKIFGDASNLVAMFAYAILITIIVVLITFYLGRITNKIKEEITPKEEK
jgi:hypothetical protein